MKIISYNVNGIRSAIRKGLLEWIEEHDFDVVCIQETKSQPDAAPALLLENLGYKYYWHPAQRKGYSGVATFCKTEPSKVFKGIGINKYDEEGRVLRTDFDDLTIINSYFPNGGQGETRQQFKMQFLDVFQHWIQRLLEDRPNIIALGDFNIAHQKIDINSPQRNHSKSGFLPVERQWFSNWLDTGFVDAFRYLHPEAISYTWWRATQYARKSNKGWRLDYQCVSDHLVHRIKSATHLHDAHHSDHCPVLLELSPI